MKILIFTIFFLTLFVLGEKTRLEMKLNSQLASEATLTGSTCCCEDCHGSTNVKIKKVGDGTSCNTQCKSGRYWYYRDGRATELRCKSDDGWGCAFKSSKTAYKNKYGYGSIIRDNVIRYGLKKGSGWKPHRYHNFVTCRQSSKTYLYIKVKVDCQNEDDMNRDLFRELSAAARSGLRSYWSRPGMNVNSNLYIPSRTNPKVVVSFVETSDTKMDLDIYREKGKKYARSYNPMIWDASIYYNEGWYKNNYGSNWKSNAIKDFKETAAHEFGHSILYGYDGLKHTMTHKGTSSWGQEANGKAKYPPYPEKFDLMKYYKGDAGDVRNYFGRAIIVNSDIYKLIASCDKYTLV